MPKDNDLLKMHPFDLAGRSIENPLEDYARHIRAFDEGSGVTLETAFEELPYEDEIIEGDLEYLTTADFLDRSIQDDGSRTYELTDEATDYLEAFRGRTEDYTEVVDETLRGDL
jgi:hypothetical protein